ncbi:hypothetical protein JZ751_012252 [Albula glossodonta]|uniref:Uncharacterized protein n=1 Tax=Albula glossodonta TaxID=121402 RepID=A0A8T2PS33_9TELE|nr:hypothetical protein JZ751_012252 [Albula glossodonta]
MESRKGLLRLSYRVLYDAFGKLASDVEGGNVNRPGSIQECQLAKGPGFNGRYCQLFVKQIFQQGIKSLIPPIPPVILSDPTQSIYATQCFTNTSPDFAIIISLFVCCILIAGPLMATMYIALVRWRQQKEVGPGVDTALHTTLNHYGTLMSNGCPMTNNNGCVVPEATPTQSCKIKEDRRKKSKYTVF